MLIPNDRMPAWQIGWINMIMVVVVGAMSREKGTFLAGRKSNFLSTN